MSNLRTESFNWNLGFPHYVSKSSAECSMRWFWTAIDSYLVEWCSRFNWYAAYLSLLKLVSHISSHPILFAILSICLYCDKYRRFIACQYSSTRSLCILYCHRWKWFTKKLTCSDVSIDASASTIHYGYTRTSPRHNIDYCIAIATLTLRFGQDRIRVDPFFISSFAEKKKEKTTTKKHLDSIVYNTRTTTTTNHHHHLSACIRFMLVRQSFICSEEWITFHMAAPSNHAHHLI